MKPIENRKHHYVPQFILRNFVSEGREYLHAFDKWHGSDFKVAVGDAAAEKGFYSYDTDEVKGCAEEFLTIIETKASPVVQRIVEDKKLTKLDDPQNKAFLATLVVAQLLRSKNRRAINFQIREILRDLAEREGTPEFVEWVGKEEPEKEKRLAIVHLREELFSMTPALADKDVLLYVSAPAHPLLIGDSPLIPINTTNKSSLYGTTGLLSVGVEIYLPLSPSVVLAFICPTVAERMKQVIRIEGRKAPEIAFEYLLAIEHSRPITLDATHVDFLNSQQVVASERFIYSASSDFSLVKEIVKKDPSLRKGMRVTTN